MRFTWRDGFTRDIPAGDQVRGLVHDMERPVSVHIDPKEIFDVFYEGRPPTKEMEAQWNKYLNTEVTPVINYPMKRAECETERPGMFSPETGWMCFPYKITRFVLVYGDGTARTLYAWWGHWKLYATKQNGQRFVEAYVPEDANPELIQALHRSCHPLGSGVFLTKRVYDN